MHAGLYKLELFELYFQMIKTARKSYDPEPNRLCNPCTILFASVFFSSAWPEKAHIYPRFKFSL